MSFIFSLNFEHKVNFLSLDLTLIQSLVVNSVEIFFAGVTPLLASW